jgi:putative addiction module component (TIGR02574 family)
MAIRDRLAEESRSEAPPVEADLCNELDRRWAAHLQNPAAAMAWEQVLCQLGLG